MEKCSVSPLILLCLLPGTPNLIPARTNAIESLSATRQEPHQAHNVRATAHPHPVFSIPPDDPNNELSLKQTHITA
jgi:hypothetical protein